MGLFKNNKRVRKIKELIVYPPFNGVAKSIESIGDGFFSDKKIGDGMLVFPHSLVKKIDVLSPITGEVEKIVGQGHAFIIRSESGVEVYVQFGIDSDRLKGKGIELFFTKDQWVNSGEKIASLDLSVLRKGCDFCGAIVIVTSGHFIKNKNFGDVTIFDDLFGVEV